MTREETLEENFEPPTRLHLLLFKLLPKYLALIVVSAAIAAVLVWGGPIAVAGLYLSSIAAPKLFGLLIGTLATLLCGGAIGRDIYKYSKCNRNITAVDFNALRSSQKNEHANKPKLEPESIWLLPPDNGVRSTNSVGTDSHSSEQTNQDDPGLSSGCDEKTAPRRTSEAYLVIWARLNIEINNDQTKPSPPPSMNPQTEDPEYDDTYITCHPPITDHADHHHSRLYR